MILSCERVMYSVYSIFVFTMFYVFSVSAFDYSAGQLASWPVLSLALALIMHVIYVYCCYDEKWFHYHDRDVLCYMLLLLFLASDIDTGIANVITFFDIANYVLQS